VDEGKVMIYVLAEFTTPAAVAAIAEKLGETLRSAGVGDVTSHAELDYEPFTPGVEEFGHRWHRITVNLDTALALGRAASLFLAAGVPRSSHIMYTDRMRLCGQTLGRV